LPVLLPRTLQRTGKRTLERTAVNAAIDAIIIWPDKLTLKVIATPITINNRHENSEVTFVPYWNEILPMGEPVTIKSLPPGFNQYELILL